MLKADANLKIAKILIIKDAEILYIIVLLSPRQLPPDAELCIKTQRKLLVKTKKISKTKRVYFEG